MGILPKFCFVWKQKSHPVAQVGLELTVVLLPQIPECWNYGCVPPLFSQASLA